MHRNRPFDPREPFPRFRALQAGLPRALVDSPAFRRLLHGVIVDADVPDSALLRVKAALACFFDDAHASHASAARVWRVPVETRPGEHVTVPDDGHRLRRIGVTSHHRAGAAVAVRHGVRVSVLTDLFVELAEELSLVELVVAGDWMVRRHHVRIKDLRRAATDAPGRAGHHHVERIEQWESDLGRREEIDDEGWRILVVVAAGVYTDPGRTVERVFRLLGARGLEGLPERPSEDWRPHFPGRSAA